MDIWGAGLVLDAGEVLEECQGIRRLCAVFLIFEVLWNERASELI